MQSDFYQNKKVLITGHTGFKGTWLCKLLLMAGAKVHGYALEAPTQPSLFALTGMQQQMHSVTGNICDFAHLQEVMRQVQPEIVLHLAAQPLVRKSYQDPVATYQTNVMGTVNVLECVRRTDSVKSFLNVTTDKVYHNREWCWGYRETDELDGYDPYSNSKSCSELVTHSYAASFLQAQDVRVSTARAGNVIGGGDFAADRLLPDCVRAARAGEPIRVRNPHAIRPFQHVLEPLSAYLLIVRRQYEDAACAGWYNIGPRDEDCITTGTMTDLFCQAWGEGQNWVYQGDDGPHEANFLKLDCSKLEQSLGWHPRWHIAEAVFRTVEWTKVWCAGGDVDRALVEQIEAFFKDRGQAHV